MCTWSCPAEASPSMVSAGSPRDRRSCCRCAFSASCSGALYDAGRLGFFGALEPLAERRAFLHHLAPVRKKRWAVYAKPPFTGPEAVLAYLSRYTHRVAISNRRLLAFN